MIGIQRELLKMFDLLLQSDRNAHFLQVAFGAGFDLFSCVMKVISHQCDMNSQGLLFDFRGSTTNQTIIVTSVHIMIQILQADPY